MTNDHKNENEANTSFETDALKDCDLEKVSGGTILPFDVCEHQFANGRCMNTLWGNCKYFNSTLVKKEESPHLTVIYYKGSCSKGYFQDVPYKDYQ